MKNLVIKGHQTRGSEVIEILKMLGGKNSTKLVGSASSCGYYIDSDGNIAYHYYSSSYFNNAIQFTLEEFFEKYPYKVGDRVQSKVGALDSKIYIIKSMEWNNFVGQIYYTIKTTDDIVNPHKWIAQEFIFHKEEIMEETIIDTIKESKDRYRLSINYQYEIEVDEGEYYIVRRKPQYPKTYEECCKVLNLTKYPPALVPNKATYISQYEDFPCYYEIQKLAQLLVCRNAYWKIAGEQMGLGKPWEPDTCQIVYSIGRDSNRISLCNDMFGGYFILEFPTKEMRDTFYENFKDSIEQCKELL